MTNVVDVKKTVAYLAAFPTSAMDRSAIQRSPTSRSKNPSVEETTNMAS